MPCVDCSSFLYLSGPAPAPQHWRLDIPSALIGAAVALLLVGLSYRYRDALRRGWEGLVAPLIRLRNHVRASTEDRYSQLVIARARSLVVPSRLVTLDEIFVEPILSLPPSIPQSLSQIETLPSGPRTLPLHQALGKHPRLAIIGDPGAGRTTLLAYVALACARTAGDHGNYAAVGVTLGPVEERLPLYVPLPAIDWNQTEDADGHAIDGVERLLRAAVAAVGGNGRMAAAVHQRLEAGRAIVLVDGWDELSPQQSQAAGAWLADTADRLPANVWLVSAGRRGYGRLTEAGFVPLTLAPWDAGQVETFARLWLGTRTPGEELTPLALRRLVADLQGATRAGAPPLDLVLRALVTHADGEVPAGREALFERALDHLLWQEEDPWLSDACKTILEQVALSLQREGRATASREDVEGAIEAVIPAAEEQPARVSARVFRALTSTQGLLRPVGAHRYAPAHPLWQAYLAARQLDASDAEELIERLDDPLWDEVLRFHAELGDMGPLVAAWLRHPDDMFRTRLRRLSPWIGAAPAGASWRDGALAVLARTLLQPDLPGPARQALAEALAATGATGLTYFFTQAIQHPDPEIRAAAALGLTQRASESDLPAIETVIGDESAIVREAAVRGLAHLDSDAATHWLGQILMAADETLGPLAAEALAHRGGEGVAFLHEAINSENVMARRAAILGLAQVEARDPLEKAAREDEQWIVRSAATAALDELDEQSSITGIAPPPEINKLPWLISWAASRGEGVGLGKAAYQMLRRALREGEPSVRLAVAQVLTQVGRPEDIEPLRTALADADPLVAGEALEALAEISERYDLRIE